jgi:hypothetical protein
MSKDKKYYHSLKNAKQQMCTLSYSGLGLNFFLQYWRVNKMASYLDPKQNVQFFSHVKFITTWLNSGNLNHIKPLYMVEMDDP